MFQSLCRLGLSAALFGLLFVPAAALAQDKRVRHVQDDAHLFSKDAITQANATIAKIKEKHKKDLFIETVAEGPEKDFPGWAKVRFNNAAVDGVYVVLSKKPKRFQIDVGDETLRQGLFSRADIKELESIVKGKSTNDEILNKIATYTLETFNEHNKGKPAPQPKENVAPGKRAQAPPVVHEPGGNHIQESAMPPWVGWVCMIVAVLFVVWIVFAIIRAMTGAMGGGYGGGGYGGGYGGGGMGMGGGFLTGMLGGLFGSMAGMYLYNNFFGGHASYGPNGNVNWGGNDAGAGGANAPYQGDTDVGASGGGEWGGGDDNAAGGDAGGNDDAGGGEWGGADDAGGGDVGGGDAGGGDWGGGGDAGGGDWGGGGGGGDWGGGGGGDFGGGGGGGDW